MIALFSMIEKREVVEQRLLMTFLKSSRYYTDILVSLRQEVLNQILENTLVVSTNVQISLVVSFKLFFWLVLEWIQSDQANMIYTFTANQSFSLLLQILSAYLLFNLKLETIWKKSLFLKVINPAVNNKKPDFLIHEVFVIILLIALSF